MSVRASTVDKNIEGAEQSAPPGKQNKTMPFKSLKQEGYMHEHPEILGKKGLAEWDAATKGKKLPKKKRKIAMTEKELGTEHKKLIPILEHGSKKQQEKEAKGQLKEMKEYGIKMKKVKKKRGIVDEARDSVKKLELMQFGDKALLNKGQGAQGNSVSTIPLVKRKAKRGLTKKVGNNNPDAPVLPEFRKKRNITKRNLGYSKVKVGSPMILKTSIPTPAERVAKRIQRKMGTIKSNFRNC